MTVSQKLTYLLRRESINRMMDSYQKNAAIVKRNFVGKRPQLWYLTAGKTNVIMKHVYEDMMVDVVKRGLKLTPGFFLTQIAGWMKRSRLKDALYFAKQMQTLGLQLNVTVYNFLISTCGKCKNSNKAILILEEMKCMGVKPIYKPTTA